MYITLYVVVHGNINALPNSSLALFCHVRHRDNSAVTVTIAIGVSSSAGGCTRRARTRDGNESGEAERPIEALVEFKCGVRVPKLLRSVVQHCDFPTGK